MSRNIYIYVICVSIDGLGHRLGPPFLFQHFAFDLQYFTFLHITTEYRIYIYTYIYNIYIYLCIVPLQHRLCLGFLLGFA